MYIKSIIIKNFRQFDNFEMECNSGINLLIGENNSGKTTLIDAIRYTLGTNSQDRVYFKESDFNNEKNEIKIELIFDDLKDPHRYIEHLSYDESAKETLYLTLTAKLDRSKEKRGHSIIRVDRKTGVDGNGIQADSILMEILTATYLKPLRDAESDLSAGQYSRLSQILKSSLAEGEALDGLFEILKNIEKAIEENEFIGEKNKKITTDYLTKLSLTNDKKESKILVSSKTAGSETAEQKKKLIKTLFDKLTLTLNQDGKQEGLGYNNILFMATELLLLEEDSSDMQLLLVEEPEAHLHPQLQTKLIQFIKNKSDEIKNTDDNGTIQCFLTTHSPNISSMIYPENIFIMKSGKAYSLRKECTKLTSEGADHDYKFLEKFLDVTKSNMFFAKGVMIVEGDAENILLPTIAKLLGRNFDDYGVSIVNVGSKAWKRYAKLLLREKEDSPIRASILSDLDLWPDCAEKGVGIYGFKDKIEPKPSGKGGNLNYWLSNCDDLKKYIVKQKEESKTLLESDNVKVFISNDWTFEYCLAKYGLMNELMTSNNIEKEFTADDTIDDKCTYVLNNCGKSDSAYNLASILEDLYSEEPKKLKEKLPSYIVEAIEHVTEKIPSNSEEGGE